MRASIVVPVYNALSLSQACVESIFREGAEISFEVIVVNNGSTPEVADWLAVAGSRHSGLRHLYFAEALGFARAASVGAAAAIGEIIVILNSDTVVAPHWLDALCDALWSDPSLGAVTPETNQSGEPAQMDFATIDLSASRAIALRAAREPNDSVLYLPQRLTFFCVALRAEVWRSVGGLNESYRTGNFEDDDLCLRLRMAGYRLGVARSSFVYHHNNATFLENHIDHEQWLTDNAVLFAARARGFALAEVPLTRLWPKGAAHEVSVVIHVRRNGSLEDTLRSLAHQTVEGFETVSPGSAEGPTRVWVAHVMQGDILYPFHIEALLDALGRASADAIVADGWIALDKRACPHPDAARSSRRAPFMLAGWMHHSSLDPARLCEQCVPIHWPRLTWEMPEPRHVREERPPVTRPGPMDLARGIYRRAVPFETRVAIDEHLRRWTGLSLAEPVRHHESNPLRELAATLDALLASRTETGRFEVGSRLPPVVMFNAIAWHSATQRQQHFARGLAERGHQVFWVETDLRGPAHWWNGRPLQQVAPCVHIIRLPALHQNIYHMNWTETAVRAMCSALVLIASAYGLRNVVSLVNYPRWQPVVDRLREKAGWRLVYDCLDDQSALADLYSIPAGNYEELLAGAADAMFTSSAVLHERFARFSPLLLHNAADFDLFSSALPMGHLGRLPRPVIGFFGALADWLDMDLIHAVALRFPEWSFVYIGPSTFSSTAVGSKWFRSTHLPNITVLGQMEPRTLAAHLAEFDVCTMPFQDVPVTRTMNAVKLYEYLAAGKPVVSRNLPEVHHLKKGGAGDLIAVYSSREEFFARLTEALALRTPELASRRREFARQNDWSRRIDVLSQKIIEVA